MNEEEKNSPNAPESESSEKLFYGMTFAEIIHRINLNWEERVVPNLWKSPEGCLLWRGKHSPDGYGCMRLGAVTSARVHMVSYMYHTQQPIPRNIEVCHTCDVPDCANFQHLFLGTKSDNMRDMVQKGRKAKNYYSKLTTQQILDIKQLLREGKLTQTQIAKRFFVGQATISEIKNDRRPLFAGTKAI